MGKNGFCKINFDVGFRDVIMRTSTTSQSAANLYKTIKAV